MLFPPVRYSSTDYKAIGVPFFLNTSCHEIQRVMCRQPHGRCTGCEHNSRVLWWFVGHWPAPSVSGHGRSPCGRHHSTGDSERAEKEQNQKQSGDLDDTPDEEAGFRLQEAEKPPCEERPWAVFVSEAAFLFGGSIGTMRANIRIINTFFINIVSWRDNFSLLRGAELYWSRCGTVVRVSA